jgi:hypothetical protein
MTLRLVRLLHCFSSNRMKRDEGRAGCGTGAAPDCRFLRDYTHAREAVAVKRERCLSAPNN